MFTVNTADTDALSQSGTYYIMQQRIEGYDTRRLNMGQSNAQSSTFSGNRLESLDKLYPRSGKHRDRKEAEDFNAQTNDS